MPLNLPSFFGSGNKIKLKPTEREETITALRYYYEHLNVVANTNAPTSLPSIEIISDRVTTNTVLLSDLHLLIHALQMLREAAKAGLLPQPNLPANAFGGNFALLMSDSLLSLQQKLYDKALDNGISIPEPIFVLKR